MLLDVFNVHAGSDSNHYQKAESKDNLFHTIFIIPHGEK